METFDEDKIRGALAKLEPWKRVAFMALSCERMLPNYSRFASATNFGDSQILRRGLDVAWTWVESNQIPPELDSIRSQVERQAPHTAMFVSPFTSAALDAANAVASVLDAVEKPDGADAIGVACLARDTVDIYIQEVDRLDPNDRELEETIRCHPLMQAELRSQREDIRRLEQWTRSRPEAVQHFRSTSIGQSAGSLLPVIVV